MTSNEMIADSAFYYIEDAFERILAPFFVLGNTAKQMYEHPDQDLLGPVEVGIKKGELTPSRLSTLKSLLPSAEFTDKTIKLEYAGVPITVRIIGRAFETLKNPQIGFFKVTNVMLPNPFNKYWKERNFVQ